MKKILCITVICLLFLLKGNSQPISDSEKVAILQATEKYVENYIESWGCSYSRGSMIISTKEELGDNIIYNGKVGYRSGNCGSVNASLRVELRQFEENMFLTRLCVQMPYCVFGNVLRYDNECKDYNQKIDYFVESKPLQSNLKKASDVDINIPITYLTKASTYALVIGNEDYASFQTGLSQEINVDFAINDAKVFADYCIKTLGIPERQVKVLTNATAAQMKQAVAWLAELALVEEGNAELLVYYSGHGLPHESNRTPYLMPVDVTGGQIELALPLKDMYEALNKNPVKGIYVFLDACFSGGAPNQPLIVAKAVKVRPRKPEIAGNMFVLSSSTGEESSGIYREMQHGYFTYFLLKKLQETEGNITIGELFDYVQRSVLKETVISGKKQTPSIDYGVEVTDKWRSWKLL